MKKGDAIARFPDGAPLAPPRPSPDTLALLERRRSAKWAELKAPGPSPAELERLLAIASRVPDHGKLSPWRFIVIEGRSREAFGTVLAEIWVRREPTSPQERLTLERTRFANVPVVVAIVSRAQEQHKIPVWEQELSAGGVCMTLVIAANAMGYASGWITDWFGYDRDAKAALGLKSGERVAGFIGLGSVDQLTERARPALDDLVTRWET